MKDDKLFFKNIYSKWFNENIYEHKINDIIQRLTIPLINRHNDIVDIYIITDGNKYILTDEGATITDLNSSGININVSKKTKV